MSFSKRLRELRVASGLSQEALAKELYVSRQAISKWESGRGRPDIKTIERIANYFNTSISSLLDEDDLKIGNRDYKAISIKIGLTSLTLLLTGLIFYVLFEFIIVFDSIPPTYDSAFYFSLDNEYICDDFDELKNKDLPFIIIRDGKESINYFNKDIEDTDYVLDIPIKTYKKAYAYKIIYDERENKYINEAMDDSSITTSHVFNNKSIRIREFYPVEGMEIYTYGLEFKLLRHEELKVDYGGNIYSSIDGLLKDYLALYKVNGAMQYTIIIKDRGNNRYVYNIFETTEIFTYLTSYGIRINGYSYFTKFII